jgi:hypothetical protein
MLTALIFATGQGHQEAIMWLAAMNETLLTFFLLLCLLLYAKDRAVHSAVPYVAALFSKESALMLIGILPWLQWRIDLGKRHRRTAYSLVILISLAFIALFLSLASNNFMLNTGTYAFGVHGIPVFLVSMHRMLFPYVYLALMSLLAQWRTLKIVGPVLNGLGFASIAILPYIFLTYQNHITSRQEYMASIGIAWLLATLILGFKTRAWRTIFVVVFITANIGYLWIRKDAQFEGRAAPTNRLIEVLQNNPPQNLYLNGFQENPWIAKGTSRMVNGWKSELIHVNETLTPPVGALQFRWDPVAREYKPGNKP